MKKLCVFCGSRIGNERYRRAAREFGTALAHAGWSLVYGGGRVGLMGEVADAALAAGGYVTGVIPSFLNRQEVAHPQLQSCHTVRDLFERKAMMMELADAFVALPGGIGTYDELLEVIAWRQLKQLPKPIGVLDVNGFFQPWLASLRHAAAEGFMDIEELAKLNVSENSGELLTLLAQYTPDD